MSVDFGNVTIDGKKVNLDPKANATGPKALTCKPASFCTWSGSSCGCSDTAKNSLLAKVSPTFKTLCDQTCNVWAVKDFDCPEIGCIGFSFTLPDGFKAADQYGRPKPQEFPGFVDKGVTKPWQGLVFKNTGQGPDNAKGGSCYYSADNTPNDATNCKVPD